MIKFTYNGIDFLFRSPDFGNINEISFERVNRRSRGGDVIIFRDTDWPKTEVLNLNFTLTKEADARTILYLIKETTGKIIQYTDHENRVWEGVIQNPDAELIQTGRSTWSINILFEGDQV